MPNIKLITNNDLRTVLVSIQKTEWAMESVSGLYRYDIKDTAITADCAVDINLDLASVEVAKSCNLKSVTNSYDGGVYIYAETIPTSAMSGTMIVIKS